MTIMVRVTGCACPPVRYIDCRAQTRAARGFVREAVRDYTKALELDTIFHKDHDVYHQRGLLYMKLVRAPAVHTVSMRGELRLFVVACSGVIPTA